LKCLLERLHCTVPELLGRNPRKNPQGCCSLQQREELTGWWIFPANFVWRISWNETGRFCTNILEHLREVLRKKVHVKYISHTFAVIVPANKQIHGGTIKEIVADSLVCCKDKTMLTFNS